MFTFHTVKRKHETHPCTMSSLWFTINVSHGPFHRNYYIMKTWSHLQIIYHNTKSSLVSERYLYLGCSDLGR